MSIADERRRIEDEIKSTNDISVDERYRGSDWWQVTESESEIFGLLPAAMPRLSGVYMLYCCAIEIVFEISDERVRKIREELPWLSSGITNESEWMRFAELFGVSNREAHAYFCKYSFWEDRAGLATYPDEKALL